MRRIVLLVFCSALGALLIGALLFRSDDAPSSVTHTGTHRVSTRSLEVPRSDRSTRLTDVKVEDDDREVDDDDELEHRGAATKGDPDPSPAPGLPASGGPAMLPLSLPTASDDPTLLGGDGSTDRNVDGRSFFTPEEHVPDPLSGDYFPAVRNPRRGGAAPVAEAVATPDEPASALPWVSGQARGYTMLYAMHPPARQVVERHVEALLRAHVREPYIGVLIDGTFGRDFDYLRSIIQRLSANGRTLTLVVYLTNGPTMRRWRDTTIAAPFVTIEPVEFRNRIRRDRALRTQFQSLATDAREIFKFSTAANSANRNYVVVMLEDNLQRQSYGEMRNLAQGVLQGSATFVRNPCLGCYRGNDADSAGDSREEHGLDRFPTLAPGDAYSLDGVGFVYPGGAARTDLAWDQLLALLQASYERGLRWAGLWRHSWQGLEIGQGNPHPDERLYVPSTPEQVDLEIDALRYGLPLEQVAEGE